MTTPQDIREKVFEKAVFNGYDMGEVDDFMEALADELGTLQKENSALKAKMKVLVDKIEEYRGNEGAINQTLLSAQKLSAQIESDARVRAASIIAEAEAKAADTVGGIEDRAITQEARLQAAKISTAKFLEKARTMCKEQLANLDAITAATREELAVETPAAQEERIPEENIEIEPKPAVSSEELDNGNTQVFLFSKDN